MALHQETHFPVAQDELAWALKGGAMAGVAAGIGFALFELLASAVVGDGLLAPVRMAGAILLGRDALSPYFPALAAGIAGAGVHVALSAIYGMMFAALAGGLHSRLWEVTFGGLFGLALWLINFYLVSPIAFPWFLETNPFVQFIGHTFFFGAVLGLLVWRASEPSATS